MTLANAMLCAAFLLQPLPVVSDTARELRGFSAANAQAQWDWEQKFRAIPEPERMRETMARLSAHPHHVGSAQDKANAEWALARFREWGFEARIETFEVLFPTPRERSVELLEPVPFRAGLGEPAIPGDPSTAQQGEQLPPYNAYSRDGDVTGRLVYVNFGRPEDYEQLERMGVGVQGAIVLARYGGCWRGVKPRLAAEHGAIGCLIYSDPHEDGYFQAEPYPAGPARPKDGAQRGSVLGMQIYPGDPLTPGIGALPGAKRLDLEAAQTLTPIPVLPLSYGDAEPLLRALAGPVVPEPWRGALPLTYHAGPGPAKVRLKVRSDWNMKTLYDVVARIPGATEPGQWIIRGNHHDAWVNGAADPVSGASALLEEARALGELRRQGWRPRRTILYCLWDGEEPGLLGSTEWVETHAEELRQHGAVYINSDGNGRGLLDAGGSHSLERLVNEVARDVEDPETGLPVGQRLRLASLAQAGPDQRKELRSRPDLRIGALGSGSDYTAFLDHAGVASLDLGFGGEGLEAGQYHSAYDDFRWYTRFADTRFVYGRALAQTAGTLVLRLADAELLPLQFGNLADTVKGYVGELAKLADDQRREIEERNRQIDEGVFTASADPAKTLIPPAREGVPPHVNLAPLATAADRLARAAEAVDRALAAPRADLPAGVNPRLADCERRLLDQAGLPQRPWFRHVVYAPGLYTGYGVKTFPGVREAIERKQWPEAEAQAVRAARALDGAADLLAEITGMLAS